MKFVPTMILRKRSRHLSCSSSVSAMAQERRLPAMADPKMLHISTRSGKVRVTAKPGAALAVDGGIIEVATDGTTHVIGARGSDRIDVTCAAGTDVVIGTVSGSVELVGELGAASVATISGKIQCRTRATRRRAHEVGTSRDRSRATRSAASSRSRRA